MKAGKEGGRTHNTIVFWEINEKAQNDPSMCKY